MTKAAARTRKKNNKKKQLNGPRSRWAWPVPRGGAWKREGWGGGVCEEVCSVEEAGLQSGVDWQPSGVRVAGNISTFACMKERSGRPAITFAASSLRFSSFLGFLSNKQNNNNVYKKVLHHLLGKNTTFNIHVNRGKKKLSLCRNSRIKDCVQLMSESQIKG